MKNRASSMRVELVRCGRAPLSICDRYDWLMDCLSSRFKRAHYFLLGHLAAQAAQRAFHLAQIADFLAQTHNCNLQ